MGLSQGGVKRASGSTQSLATARTVTHLCKEAPSGKTPGQVQATVDARLRKHLLVPSEARSVSLISWACFNCFNFAYPTQDWPLRNEDTKP